MCRETADQYVTELRREFEEFTDSLIKDRAVCRIPDNGLRVGLLRWHDWNLERKITLCRAAETVKSQELFVESCCVNTVRKDSHRAVKEMSTAPEVKKVLKLADRDKERKSYPM